MKTWFNLPADFYFHRRLNSNLYLLGFIVLSLYSAHYYLNWAKLEFEESTITAHNFLWPIKLTWLIPDRQLEDFYGWRLKQLDALKKKNHNFTSHPHKFNVNSSISKLLERFYKEETDCENIKTCSENLKVAIAGRCRLVSILDKEFGGADTEFIVQQNDTEIPVLVKTSKNIQHHTIQQGDILGFIGRVTRNQAGDVVFMAEKVEILAPTFHPDFHRSQPTSNQRRPRYGNLLQNSDLRNKFFIRSKIIGFIRRFLEDQGFLEVETPLLIKMPKGASAPRYIAHTVLNKTDYVLRISPELNLKKLIVGGFDRVFEIGRQFRNDKVDDTHNPEYTTLEFYEAYADYYDMMQKTESLISGLVKNLFGTFKIKLQTKNKQGETEIQEIDFTPPFRRVQVMPALEKALGVSLEPYTDLGSPDSVQKLLGLSKKFGLHVPTRRHTIIAEDILGKFIETFLEADCIQPTFLINYPEILSPTAKSHREENGLSERFELITGKLEIVNAYTELNDPIEQRRRYQQETESIERGEELQIRMDPDYLEALEYGLAPTGGVGIGIDRLAMMLTNSLKIQDVILFPQTKPEN